MKARLTQTMRVSKLLIGKDPDVVIEDNLPYKVEGTVIDDPLAYRLVHAGLAVAEDDECQARVDELNAERPGTAGKLAAAHNAYLEDQRARMEELEDEAFDQELEDEE